jgi:DNA-binding transcriptional LysR family regulator
MRELSDRELRVVIAIAEAGSVRGAATLLNVAQPALSKTLKNIELTFGTSLFERTPTGMRPTTIGFELVKRGKDIVGRLHQATIVLDGLIAGRAGDIRIGYTDDFQYGVLADRIAAFLQENKGADLHLVQDYSPALAKMVAAGDLDMAFLSPPIPPHLVDIVEHGLGEQPLKALLPASDPLSHRNSISISALSGKTIIVGSLQPDSGFYIQLMRAIRKASLEVTFLQGIYPTAMIASLVARGIGWSVVTDDSMPKRTDGVRLISFDDWDVTTQRSVVWRKGTLSPVANRFLDGLFHDT